tara:strand:- start:862 stop:1053 length:192 start_codon:yes stop_codon:yes gene_type:complete
MTQFYLLVLVTLHASGEITTTKEDRYDYLPSCQIAAESRQIYLTGNYEENKKYICLKEVHDVN